LEVGRERQHIQQGVHVGVVTGDAVFGLKGQKLYDLKGSNIYKLNGD
jgi:hypothetical protein